METMQLFRRQETRPGSARRLIDAQRATGEALLAFGITPQLCGFDPLSFGIRIRAERKRTGEIPLSVYLKEGAMRDAIEVSFLGADEIHAKVFPCSDRPSSGEFVCTLAALVHDCIRTAH